MEANVQHDQENQQFTIQLDGDEAELAYSSPQPDVMNFSHTFVPENSRNQGVAGRMIEAGLRYAEENNKKVIASCPAVAKYIRTHEEFQHLLV